MPRGSITRKRINGRDYYYWMYRKDGKVVNKYISSKDNNIDDLLKQVQRRRQLQKLVRSLKKEQMEMERYLRVAKDE